MLWYEFEMTQDRKMQSVSISVNQKNIIFNSKYSIILHFIF